MNEVSEAGHLMEGVRHGDVLRKDGAGLGRLDDRLWVNHGEVPIWSRQGVDAPVRQAQAESAEEGGCHVVGVAGAAGDLLSVERHGQKFVRSEVSAGQCGDTEGGRSRGSGA